MRQRTGMSRFAVLALLVGSRALGAPNLLPDPSFEEPRDRNQFGQVFHQWGGWKYEGDCSFEVGRVARTGKTSCLLAGVTAPKIRIAARDAEREVGRYRVTAFLRGLDIGEGPYRGTTEFMFDGKYIELRKSGTFGWTPLTYVAEIAEPRKVAGPSFGLMAPGWLWIDDVSLEKVPDDTPLTPQPVLGAEEAPIAPPGTVPADAVRCATCGRRNAPAWRTCHACGNDLEAPKARAAGPATRMIADFEDGRNPFHGDALAVVDAHATSGRRALRIDRSYATMDTRQDWSGYDFLKADFVVQADDPVQVYIEVRDSGTRDYWTRVNYTTVVPPGASTLAIPVRQLYVGEKARPGRMLDLKNITRFVIAHRSDSPAGPLHVDAIRLERDDAAEQVLFPGLHAFDFGTGTSPVMEGFTEVTSATLYSKGRGYGLKDARIWRADDALQPDPLYQDYLCITAGGLAVDVPNGTYRVVVNIDGPSGYWGEYQHFAKRTVLAEGRPVVDETRTFADQVKRYFRFWDTEDVPSENTFDKYQKSYFAEKRFDVAVSDGQLNLDFRSENWGCSVSTVVLFPVDKSAQGEAFLSFVEGRRRFHFDNYFKRVLHRPTGAPLAPTATDQSRGFVLFHRDFMRDVYYNDTPLPNEVCTELRAEAFAGEYEPVTFSLLPLRDLGQVAVAASDLKGPGGTIPASAVDVGFVSYRLSRVTMEGTVYTIAPRLIMPLNAAGCPKGMARRFWLTVRTPADAKPGVYQGAVGIRDGRGARAVVPFAFRVRRGTLDPVDVPAGPWGHDIKVPWQGGDPTAAAMAATLRTQSLRKLREYGFTSLSGMPTIHYKGFRNGEPVFDWSEADAQMAEAKALGFLATVGYGSGVRGFTAYYQDTAAMKAAGFEDYSAFIRAVYTPVQRHAEQAGWLPVYYNLCDEPVGDNLTRAIENAEAYRRAFPKGPPFFTGATSYSGSDPETPAFRLSKALHVANWNGHNENSVNLVRKHGGEWAYYSGGSGRWTFGCYLYKAVREFDMKFRLEWHWNVVAGDPYYALDCREDDYAWCNVTPDGRLVPSAEFERIREGLDDYRRLVTLERLARERVGTPQAEAARRLIDERMASFKLGQRNHDALFGPDDWNRFRNSVDDAVESLR